MHWFLAAPFITKPDDGWLCPFVPGRSHSFQAVPAAYWHDRSRNQTNAAQWLDYLRHGGDVWSLRSQSQPDTGIVTVFPQLALAVGLRKRFSRRTTPLLAWTFNLGGLYGGFKRRLARLALENVDRFVVHSRREVHSYSQWLEMPPEKFCFVPLQRPVSPVTFAENEEAPFVLAMGSARRDYRLFLGVMAELGYPTVIVAGPQALRGLRIAANVRVHHQLDLADCHRLAQQARINVVPLDNPTTASGQVTLIDSMMYARATVATLSIGTEDYAEHGKTAVLVEAGDHQAMKQAIASLWEDSARRRRLGEAARLYVKQQLSDQAAGRTLGAILDALAAQHG